jgi:hypothetical protein
MIDAQRLLDTLTEVPFKVRPLHPRWVPRKDQTMIFNWILRDIGRDAPGINPLSMEKTACMRTSTRTDARALECCNVYHVWKCIAAINGGLRKNGTN